MKFSRTPIFYPGDFPQLGSRVQQYGYHYTVDSTVKMPPRMKSNPRIRRKQVTCSHMAPVMVTGNGLTLPRPRFSLFLWLLKSFSSLFSSSSRELQYRTWAGNTSTDYLHVNRTKKKTHTGQMRRQERMHSHMHSRTHTRTRTLSRVA